MSESKYTTEYVQAIIKQGLTDFAVVARDNVKKRWAELKRDKKTFDAARGLLVMRDVAANPGKYFSRAETEQAWRQRNAAERKLHPECSERDVYYIVPSPTCMVTNHTNWAVAGDLWRQYYRFCDEIMHWEYARTSADSRRSVEADIHADNIMQMAQKINVQADIVKSNPVIKMAKQIGYSFCK